MLGERRSNRRRRVARVKGLDRLDSNGNTGCQLWITLAVNTRHTKKNRRSGRSLGQRWRRSKNHRSSRRIVFINGN